MALLNQSLTEPNAEPKQPRGNLEDFFLSVPDSLMKSGLWCVWKYVPRPGKKPGKMPYTPETPLRQAATSKPETFRSFTDTTEFFRKNKEHLSLNGIGIGFFNRVSGIDLDGCIDADGRPSKLATELLEKFKSYAEYSPSGTGLHILIFADLKALGFNDAAEYTARFRSRKPLPEEGFDTQELEIYLADTTSRYFTVTGNPCPGGAAEVFTKNTEVLEILNKYLRKDAAPADPRQNSTTPPCVSESPSQPREVDRSRKETAADFTDDELLEKARNDKKHGKEFTALYDYGDCSAYDNNHSRADLGLMRMLAFWTAKDPVRMERLFRKSKLMREKFDRPDYVKITINKAISYVNDCFNPREYYQRETMRDFDRMPTQAAAPAASTPNGSASADERNTPDRFGADVRAALDEGPFSDYVGSSFLQYIHDSAKYPVASTGFPLLDKPLDGGLYPGLYVIGAVSSLGKTSFVMQIADHIAAAGRHVIIVSLEMSKNELAAKSISRFTFQIAKRDNIGEANAKTSRGVLNGKKWETYSEPEQDLLTTALREYTNVAKCIRVFAPEKRITADDIGGYVDLFMEQQRDADELTGETTPPPVVIVDYLQLLNAADPHMDDKRAADDNIYKLKKLSGKHHTPVLVVSSFNRNGYAGVALMESFKESGGIEYTADVLIGLQFRCAGVEGFNVNEAKRQIPREVKAVILKNRMGATGGEYNFNFRAEFNEFQDIESFTTEPAFTPDEDALTVQKRTAAKKQQNTKKSTGMRDQYYALTEGEQDTLQALYRLAPLIDTGSGYIPSDPVPLESWKEACTGVKPDSTAALPEGDVSNLEKDFEKCKDKLLKGTSPWIFKETKDGTELYRVNNIRCSLIPEIFA